MIKLFKEQKKSQMKYYQMVLYTMKNLLPVKDILKTLPASGVNKYIKILQRQRSRKTAAKELGKMKKDKTNLKKFLQFCIYTTLSLS